MSRIKGKNTGLEKIIARELRKRAFRFVRHAKRLPGCPDIVFSRSKVVVFIDGDFWHGFRFPQWEKKLSPFWRDKIRKNRARDKRNFAKLRRNGWRVIRIWKHTIEKDLDRAMYRITLALRTASQG